MQSVVLFINSVSFYFAYWIEQIADFSHEYYCSMLSICYYLGRNYYTTSYRYILLHIIDFTCDYTNIREMNVATCCIQNCVFSAEGICSSSFCFK